MRDKPGTTQPSSTKRRTTPKIADISPAAGIDLCWNAGTKFIGDCASSVRYKDNIRGLELGLEEIRQMRPVTFSWKDSDEKGLGLIAEEIYEISPLLATFEKDGRVRGVKYKQLTALLINATQELDRKNRAMQRRSAAIQRHIAKLETENAELRARYESRILALEARADQAEQENARLKVHLERLEEIVSTQ